MVDYPLLSHGITRQTKNYCSKGHTNFLIEALDGDIRMCKVRCIYKWQKANKKTRKIIRRARVCSPTSVGTMNERLSKINGWTRKLLWKNILFEVYMPTLPSQWVKSLFWRRVLYTWFMILGEENQCICVGWIWHWRRQPRKTFSGLVLAKIFSSDFGIQYQKILSSWFLTRSICILLWPQIRVCSKFMPELTDVCRLTDICVIFLHPQYILYAYLIRYTRV